MPHFKNVVIDKSACRVCGDWWTDLSNTKCWFPKYKNYPTVKGRQKGNGNEGKFYVPKAPYEWLVHDKIGEVLAE